MVNLASQGRQLMCSQQNKRKHGEALCILCLFYFILHFLLLGDFLSSIFTYRYLTSAGPRLFQTAHAFIFGKRRHIVPINLYCTALFIGTVGYLTVQYTVQSTAAQNPHSAHSLNGLRHRRQISPRSTCLPLLPIRKVRLFAQRSFSYPVSCVVTIATASTVSAQPTRTALLFYIHRLHNKHRKTSDQKPKVCGVRCLFMYFSTRSKYIYRDRRMCAGLENGQGGCLRSSMVAAQLVTLCHPQDLFECWCAPYGAPPALLPEKQKTTSGPIIIITSFFSHLLVYLLFSYYFHFI